jgi:hypothetical protein
VTSIEVSFSSVEMHGTTLTTSATSFSSHQLSDDLMRGISSGVSMAMASVSSDESILKIAGSLNSRDNSFLGNETT